MIQLPDNYTFWWWFILALWEMLQKKWSPQKGLQYRIKLNQSIIWDSLYDQRSVLVQCRDTTSQQYDPTTGSQWANVTDRHNLVCNNNKEQYCLMPADTVRGLPVLPFSSSFYFPSFYFPVSFPSIISYTAAFYVIPSSWPAYVIQQ